MSEDSLINSVEIFFRLELNSKEQLTALKKLVPQVPNQNPQAQTARSKKKQNDQSQQTKRDDNNNNNKNNNKEKTEKPTTSASTLPREISEELANKLWGPFVCSVLDFSQPFLFNNVIKQNLCILTNKQDSQVQQRFITAQQAIWEPLCQRIEHRQIDLYQLCLRFNNMMSLPGFRDLLRQKPSLLQHLVGNLSDCVVRYLEHRKLNPLYFDEEDELFSQQSNSDPKSKLQLKSSSSSEIPTPAKVQTPSAISLAKVDAAASMEDVLGCLISIAQQLGLHFTAQFSTHATLLANVAEIALDFLHHERLDKQALRNAALLFFSAWHFSPSFYQEMGAWMLDGTAPQGFAKDHAFLTLGVYARLCLHRSLLGLVPHDATAAQQSPKGVEAEEKARLLFSVLTRTIFQLLQLFNQSLLRQSYSKNAALEVVVQGFELLADVISLSTFHQVALQGQDELLKLYNGAMSVIWTTCEDPFLHLYSVIHKAFSSCLQMYCAAAEFLEKFKACDPLLQIAERVRLLAWDRKAKYVIFSILIEHRAIEMMLEEEDFFFQFFVAFQYPGVRTIGASILTQFLASLGQEQSTRLPSQIVEPCARALTHPTVESLINKPLALYAFVPLFQKFPRFLEIFLTHLLILKPNLESQIFFLCLFSVLREARKTKALESLDNICKDEKLQLPSLLKLALAHSNQDVILDSLDFVCSSERLSCPIEPIEIDMIQFFFCQNIRCGDSRFRQEAAGSLKKFLARLKFHLTRSLKPLSNQRTKPKKSSKTEISNNNSNNSNNSKITELDWRRAGDLLDWMAQHLLRSCYPGSTYHRQQFSLEILETLAGSLAEISPLLQQQEKNLYLFSPDATAILLHVFWNSFEISRQLAFQILCHIPGAFANQPQLQDALPLLQTAVRLLCSPRGKEGEAGCLLILLFLKKYFVPTNTVISFRTNLQNPEKTELAVVANATTSGTENSIFLALLQNLLTHLQFQLRLAQQDLKVACQIQPMHGLLSLIRKIIEMIDFNQLPTETVRGYLLELIDTGFSILDACLIVLGDLSPEGYDDFSTSDRTTGQLMSSVTFMSLKEVCSILGRICTTVKMPTSHEEDMQSALLNSRIFKSIGDKLLDTLMNVKHKGAIDKAALGFQDLSYGLLSSNYVELVRLPQGWLEDVFSKIEGQELVLRRSAGLPYAFAGILKAELMQKGKDELCTLVVSRLLEKARKDSTLVQIHSINILYRLATHSGLSPHITKFTEQLFQLALWGFQSGDWGVRNSSTLLFSVMCDRMVFQRRSSGAKLGVTFSEFFAKWPSLYTHLLETLKGIVAELQTAEAQRRAILEACLYALLLLLSRLGPDPIHYRGAEVSVENTTSNEKNTVPSSEREITNERNKDNNSNQAVVGLQWFQPEPFAQIVQGAAHSSNWMVRTIAAQALIPLLSSNELPRTALALLDDLKKKAPFNQIHGKLQQLSCVCAAHMPLAGPSVVSEMKEQVFSRVQSDLAKFVQNSPVGATVAPVFDLVAEQLDPQDPPFVRFLQMALEVLFQSYPTIAIARSLALEAACRLVLKAVFSPEQPSLDIRLIKDLLAHPCYETRYATLKFLKKKNITSIQEPEGTELSSFMLTRLLEQTEDHFRCQRQIFHLISNLSPKTLILTLNRQTEFSFSQFVKTYFPSDVQFRAFPFLGFCFKVLNSAKSQQVKDPFTPEVCLLLQKLLVEFRKADQILDYRESAAQCVMSILEIPQETYKQLEPYKHDLVVQSWLTVVTLLSDMDPDIRESLASFLAKFFKVNLSINNSQATNTLLDFLDSQFGESQELTNYLLINLFTTASEKNPIENDAVYVTKPFFEIDEANDYEEELEKIQLASLHLRKIIGKRAIGRPEDMPGDFLISQLQEMLKYMKDNVPFLQQKYLWTDSLSFQPTIFLFFYRCLAGLIAFSSTLTENEISRLSGLLPLATQLLLHPILAAQIEFISFELKKITPPEDLVKKNFFGLFTNDG